MKLARPIAEQEEELQAERKEAAFAAETSRPVGVAGGEGGEDGKEETAQREHGQAKVCSEVLWTPSNLSHHP